MLPGPCWYWTKQRRLELAGFCAHFKKLIIGLPNMARILFGGYDTAKMVEIFVAREAKFVKLLEGLLYDRFGGIDGRKQA